jgi:hypothetical protein
MCFVKGYKETDPALEIARNCSMFGRRVTHTGDALDRMLTELALKCQRRLATMRPSSTCSI